MKKAIKLLLVEDSASDAESLLLLNRTLESRVQARTAELDEANRELEAFAHTVAHDLRAPLRHVEGFLYMLDRHLGGDLDDKGRHFMASAVLASRRMAQLIDGLLAYSRVGRAAFHGHRVELGPLVRSVIQGAQEDPGVRPARWIVGELPTVHGDPVLLRQMLEHLVANALKFTRGRAEAVIEFQSLAPETGFVLRDNGVGFDPAYAHKLFQVFQRLHREDEFEGTGIGLAIVHRIAVRHGGRVLAQGAPGQGAAFSVILPAGNGGTP